MHILARLFLLAVPFVSNEVTWRVTSPELTYFPAPRAALVAADRAGYVVTWSEVTQGLSHACAGTLTANGHLDKVGLCTSGTGDAALAVPSGDGYVAAWLEPEAGDARPNLITGALDRNFALRGAQLAGLSDGVPVIRAAGSRVWLATAATLYELDDAGAARSSSTFSQRIDDLAVSGDQIGYVFHLRSKGFGTPWVQSVMFGRLAGSASTFQFGTTDDDIAVAVGANDNGFLVLWSEGNSLQASFFGPDSRPGFVRRVVVAPVAGTPSRPQVAWDGARWLAVWSTLNGIQAAAIAPDLTATSFRISFAGSRPAVAASSPGHFLVTYEVVEALQRRLVSRVIDFNPPRTRVVR